MPFCFHKCHYCDFYSLAEGAKEHGSRHGRFVDRLIAELELRAGQYRFDLRTIFVGGGTPTLLEPDLWQRLLGAMARTLPLNNLVEFTIEANPETVTPELLAVLRAGGVNRMSIGAQSFDPQLLKTLERWHDVANVGRAVELGRAAGIDNINLDLIFGIPGQSLDMLERDLDQLLALSPDHVSCYGLTYEPNTAMTQRLKMGQFKAMDEQSERQMYERVMQRLRDAGFEHYEISNWARIESTPCPDIQGEGVAPIERGNNARRCRHNMMYWRNGNWLGVGPGAASHVRGTRWKNLPNLTQYLMTEPEPPVIDEETLPPDQHVGEQLMLWLRLLEGAELAWLNALLAGDDARRQTIDELVQIEMLERTPTHLRLTRRGLFVADTVIGKLL